MNFYLMQFFLKKFCEETCLHGFSFALSSPHFSLAIMYGVLIVGSFWLIVRDGSVLYHKYINEPTTFQLSVIKNNTFDIGLPTVCFVADTFDVHYNGIWYTSYDKEFFRVTSQTGQVKFLNNTQSSLRSLDTLFSSYHYNISSLISEVSSFTTNAEFKSWFAKKRLPLALAYQTVASLAAFEAKFVSINSSWKSYLSEGETELVRQFFINKEIDFPEVAQLVALIVCRRAEFQFDNVSNFCGTARLTWWGFTDFSFGYDTSPKICFKFASRRFTFESPVQSHSVRVFGLNNTRSGDAMCHIFLDFSGRIGYYSKYSKSSSVEVCYPHDQTVTIGMDYEILMLNLGRKPCKYYDKLTCIVKCQLDFYFSSCNCSPITIFTEDIHPPPIPFCASLPFMNLSEPLLNSSLIEAKRLISCKSGIDSFMKCQNSCPKECQRRQFSLTYATTMELSNSGIKTLFVPDLTYLYLNESLFFTFYDALMAFGGSIGLWYVKYCFD